MNKKDSDSIAAKAGHLLGIIMVACITLLFGGAAIVTTVKLISMFTMWMLF